jgi:hypothetical protein
MPHAFSYRPLEGAQPVDIDGIKLAVFEQMDGPKVVGFAVAPLNAFAMHGEQHDARDLTVEGRGGAAVASAADLSGDLDTGALAKARKYLGMLEMSLKLDKVFAHGVVGDDSEQGIPKIDIPITEGDDRGKVLSAINSNLQFFAEYVSEPVEYDVTVRSANKADIFTAVMKAVDDYAPSAKDKEPVRQALAKLGMEYIAREGKYSGPVFGSGVDFAVVNDANAKLPWNEAVELAGAFAAIAEKVEALGAERGAAARGA